MTDRRSPQPAEPLSHWVLFWLLAGMGLATAAPCLLVPPIDALNRLSAVEAEQRTALAQLRNLADRQMEFSHRLRSDPLLSQRLALRELGRDPEGHVEYVAHEVPVIDVPEPVGDGVPMPSALPGWLAAVYPQRWAAVYQDPGWRRIVFLMGLSLMVFAVVLFDPRQQRRRCPR